MQYALILLLLIATCANAGFYGRVLTFHGDPDTCTTITTVWHEGTDSVVVVYSVNRDLSVADTIEYAFVPADSERYHCELDGLVPNTIYYYLISDGYTYSYINDTDSFKTANVKGTDCDLTLWLLADTQIDSFIVETDSRDGELYDPFADTPIIPWGDKILDGKSGELYLLDGDASAASFDSSVAYVVRIRARLDAGLMARPDLILHCGDHVKGAIEEDWRAYFAVYDTLWELAQFLSIPGSHDGYTQVKTTSNNWMFYFNIAGNGLGSGWQGDHGWSLYYENIAFIATDMINKNRNYGGDSVTVGTAQYLWLAALCEAIKVDSDIDHVFELHGSDVTPMPWKICDGAIDNRTTGVVLPCGKRTYWDGNPELYWSTEDTIKYEYVSEMRPLLTQDSINAISFESGGWYFTGQPLEVIDNYWDDCPIFECSGNPVTNRAGIGIATINSEWFTMRVEKLQTFPMAELYDYGYLFALGAHQDNYPIFSCPHWNKIKGVKLSVIWGR